VAHTVVLRRTGEAEFLFSELSEPRPDTIATVAPGILYVDLTRASDADLAAADELMAEADGVIFDMRGYPRSSGVFDLLPRLTLQQVHTDVFLWPIRSGPSERFVRYEDVTGDIDPIAPHINAPIAVLIDGRAISAAETFLGVIEEYHLGALVGSATAGTNGNNLSFVVPGGITIGMTGLLVTNHDGSPHHGVGVVPTIPVERTIEGVRNGEDEVLEAAIAALMLAQP
jgi:hypothetical protein